MAVEEKLTLKSKRLYKLQLGMLKIIPMIMAFVSLLNSVLSYFGIDLPILSFFCSCSVFTLIFIYLSSYVFKFCECHRMFLHYTVLIWIINIIDYYIGIPIDDLQYLCLQISLIGMTLFIILYLYATNNKELSI